MTTKKLTEVGQAACPAGILRGFDGDACRSTLLSDGRIYNIFNGYSHPIPDNCHPIFDQPQPIRDLVAALISAPLTADSSLHLTHVSHQLDGRDLCEVGSQLAANGCDASVLDNTRIVLQGDTVLQSCTITYNNGDLTRSLDPMLSGQSAKAFIAAVLGTDTEDKNEIIVRAEQLNAPRVLLSSATKLTEAGFRVTGSDFEGASMRTIILTGVGGIRAELRWIV
jgi:hypothetical protein